MDRTVKLAVAAAVLLTGIAAALLFRREPHGSARPGPPPGEQLVLRNQTGPPQAKAAAGPPASPRPPVVEPREATDRRASRPETLGLPATLGPPPALAQSYSDGMNSAAAGPGDFDDSLGLHALPAAAGPSYGQVRNPATVFGDVPQTHTIVDGDTLEALAARYLGSADRAAEIYELNREVLPGPEVLPIGAELRLPPREPAA
jgi:nucleoid-associated protein YgaU